MNSIQQYFVISIENGNRKDHLNLKNVLAAGKHRQAGFVPHPQGVAARLEHSSKKKSTRTPALLSFGRSCYLIEAVYDPDFFIYLFFYLCRSLSWLFFHIKQAKWTEWHPPFDQWGKTLHHEELNRVNEPSFVGLVSRVYEFHIWWIITRFYLPRMFEGQSRWKDEAAEYLIPVLRRLQRVLSLTNRIQDELLVGKS